MRGIISECQELVSLRRIPGEDIVNEYGAEMRSSFEYAQSLPDATHVIIPAHREVEDLPATLLALGRSMHAVIPVVVDSHSEDGGATISVAERMGAIVCTESKGRKMAATQKGLQVVADRFPNRPVLLTDADTLVFSSWAGAMKDELQSGCTPDTGGALFANSAIWNGGNRLVDAMRTAMRYRKFLQREQSDERPSAYGHNYGLVMDEAGVVFNAIADLSPDYIYQDDAATRDALIEAGVPILTSHSLQTLVIERGDRVPSLRAFLSYSGDNANRLASYQQQYGKVFIPSDGVPPTPFWQPEAQ